MFKFSDHKTLLVDFLTKLSHVIEIKELVVVSFYRFKVHVLWKHEAEHVWAGIFTYIPLKYDYKWHTFNI